MPRTEVILFKEEDKSVPLVNWLRSVPKKPRTKCIAALTRLEELGHELRRPEQTTSGTTSTSFASGFRASTTACSIFSTEGRWRSFRMDVRKNARCLSEKLTTPSR